MKKNRERERKKRKRHEYKSKIIKKNKTNNYQTFAKKGKEKC